MKKVTEQTMNMKKVTNRTKNWLKDEQSSLSSENGMLISFVVICILVLGPIIWEPIKTGYETIMARFTKAANNEDITNWN